jgi:hypothetical protein
MSLLIRMIISQCWGKILPILDISLIQILTSHVKALRYRTNLIIDSITTHLDKHDVNLPHTNFDISFYQDSTLPYLL